MFKNHSRIFNAALLILLWVSLGLVGCAKNELIAPPGPQDAWDKAKKLFAREKYLRAQEALRDITFNYPGSSFIDSVQFLLARTSFEAGDYLTAADEFHKIQDLYPNSALAGAAAFWDARSYFEQSPVAALDQEITLKAQEGFQRFLEDFPKDALADSGYHYLGLCREKLARKEYNAATLYFDLQEYASAVLYSDYILTNYYDTPLAGPAQFLRARCFYALKDWDRARPELELYLKKYPDGRFVFRAREMLAFIQTQPKTTSPSQP